MENDVIIARGADGYYHPKDEPEVIALIKYAARNGLQVRARGASHSTAWSIFTDPVDGKPVNMTLTTTPPAGDNINLALDRMSDLVWIDEANGIVEAGPGIHLGPDPYDPIGTATLENSLLYQLFEKNWGINDLGGITHQTLSGFTATGSAGGTMKHPLNNVIGIRIVDGTGTARWIEENDDSFAAALVSVGLLGIITRMRLKLNPTFLVRGEETTTPPDKGCAIDLFGPGDSNGPGGTARPSLRAFLESTDYCRMDWWPQPGAERVVIWQAKRDDNPPPKGYPLKPYEELPENLVGWTEQLAGAIVYRILGNPGFGAVPRVAAAYPRFVTCVAAMWGGGAGASVGASIIAAILFFLLLIPTLFFILVPSLLKALFPTILGFLQPMSNGQPTEFDDYYWRSLPMDNTADDILLGTEFTEIWVPIQYTEQCMNLLKAFFATGEKARGFYSLEIYATAPSKAWLSPAYSDGADAYKDGFVRFDVYWYRGNDGEPNVEGGFYQGYWNLFLENRIPFRFHWGKFIPAYDFPFWAEHYRRELPRLDDFLALRERLDPQNIFFTRYWRERLLGHP